MDACVVCLEICSTRPCVCSNFHPLCLALYIRRYGYQCRICRTVFKLSNEAAVVSPEQNETLAAIAWIKGISLPIALAALQLRVAREADFLSLLCESQVFVDATVKNMRIFGRRRPELDLDRIGFYKDLMGTLPMVHLCISSELDHAYRECATANVHALFPRRAA